MRVSLPVIFMLQSFFVIATMVGIIVSFAVVTNNVINSAVVTVINRNLNAVEAHVNQIFQTTEPLVFQMRELSLNWKELGNNLFTPALPTIASIGHVLDLLLSHLLNNDKFSYSYQSFETTSGRWTDISCGNQTGLYTCTIGNQSTVDLYIDSGSYPQNFTVTNEVFRDATDNPYIVQIRSMTPEHLKTGLWQRASNYYDPGADAIYTLVTFSVPALFDPIDGRCILAMAIDVNTGSVSGLLADLSSDDGSLIFLVDAHSNDLLATSLSPKVLPQANISSDGLGELWEVFTAPHADIVTSISAIYSHQGQTLGNATGGAILTVGDSAVSYRHLIRNTLHWIIVSRTPYDTYLGESRRLTTTLIVIASVATVSCTLCLIAVYFAVVRPITKLSAAMGKISRLEDGGVVAEEDGPALSELRPMHEAYRKLDVAIQSFTRYVPRGVVKELIDSNQLCKLEMAPRRCSILFADIKSFTTISERLPAAVLSNLIHEYFNRATRIVLLHDGMIDKFIGDCIMAVWGAPLPQEYHELRATLCAMLLEHETRQDPLRSLFDEQGEQLGIRVGVNSGEVLAGNMGSDERMNYTVIGDAVNLSARLESFNKQMCTNVMVSEFTAAALQNKVVLRLLCHVSVVGKEFPVAVYEALGLYPAGDNKLLRYDPLDSMCMDGTASLRDFRDTHRQKRNPESASDTGSEVSMSNSDDLFAIHAVTGLLKRARKSVSATDMDVLYAARYTAAIEHFMNANFSGAIQELDEVARLFRERTETYEYDRIRNLCETYIQRPPEEFDGVYRATEK